MADGAPVYCEVIEMLKKLFGRDISDLAIYAGVECGLFLLVHLVVGVITDVTQEDTGLMFSGILMPIIAAIAAMVAAASQIGVNFTVALQFGQTRRRALGQSLGVAAVQGALAMVLALLLAGIERLFAPPLWAALVGADGVLVNYAGNRSDKPGYLFLGAAFLDWWWYPVLLAGGLALGLMIGALLQRYGAKGLWVIWAVIMLCNFFPSLSRVILVKDALLYAAITGAVLGVLGLAWSLWSLLCAVVRS